jgi:DNA-binding GntR family transcriptional regulator
VRLGFGYPDFGMLAFYVRCKYIRPVGFSAHPSVSAVLASDEPAVGKAYWAVLDAIVSRSTPAGELVAEGEVADALTMSRTPVREAFLRLSAEGLLVLYPRRGAIVTAADEDDTRELLQTRAMFETSAVRWIVDRGVPEDLGDTLRGHLESQAAAASALEFARSDRALHEAIVAAGGNSTASTLFELTGPRLLRYWHRLAESPQARARLCVEHETLVALVLAGDVDGYAALLGLHMDRVRR